MTTMWQAFLPWHIARDLAYMPLDDLIGRDERFDAVALFADVSGFTAISEALAQSGRRGAEELTDILNSYFAPMIELVVSYGGIVGKFGGDAMTILFPYTRPTRRAVVRRAIQCALDMQAAMSYYAAIPTSAGVFGLAMKAGLAEGTVLSTTIGDAAIRVEPILAGELLDRCADAEHHATKGEVVVHMPLLDGIGAVEILEERGHGGEEHFACLARLGRRARKAPLPPLPPLDTPAIEAIATYLHPSIAGRLRADASGFLNEHRKVTILFVSFAGFDYDHDPAVVAQLQEYAGAVIRTVQQYDGYLNKIDMGDKGSKYIVLFGAPLAHEDDELRAVHCALALQALPVPARIGVNTGVVFCGQVGSAVRQEYTVMGDPVNLAARLMQASQPGQVLVSDFTRRYAAAGFSWQALPSIRVKGKSEPIEIFTAGAAQAPAVQALRTPAGALPLVGRTHELAEAAALIAQVQAGRGRVFGLIADAGMGKSRLAAAIVALAGERGLAVYGGACQAYGAQTSYLVWHDIWRGMLGIDPAWPATRALQHVAQRLDQFDPQLVPRLPLLGPLLTLPIDDTPLTRSLDPQLRTELLRSLLLDLLRRLALGPQLIVLEDCHWIDPLSYELLAFLGRNLADIPLLLLVITRPPDRSGGPLEWAARLPWYAEVLLDELPPADAAELAYSKLHRIWGDELAVSAQLIEQIAQRAHGNPFYIEEIVNYLRDRQINPQDPLALQQLELPATLHSLVLSRIDQLAEDEKTTIKVASVIGRLFRASWLWGSYPPLGTPDTVRQQLQNLSRLDLTPLDRPPPDEEYLFKHITTQEVAYESLAYATRTMLHERVGGFVEQQYDAGLEQLLDVLAYHYGRGADHNKHRIYFRRAAEAARRTYANQAAIDYYERLIPLLEGVERGTALLALGEIRQLTGDWGAAEAHYREADHRGKGIVVAPAHADVARGGLFASPASFDEALQRLDAAELILARHGEWAGLGVALERIGLIAFEQGNYDRALACAGQRLVLAREQDDTDGICAALDNLGIVMFMRGEPAEALAHLGEALELAHQSGLRRREIIAGNDMAGVCWGTGDYPAAMGYLQQALAVAIEIGYQQQIGFILGNAGLLYTEAGDYQPALECFARALQIAADLGDWPAIVAALGNLAFCLDNQQYDTAADRAYQLATAIGRAIGAREFLAGDLYHHAELCAQHDRNAEALAYAGEARTIAEEVERHDVVLRAALLELRLQSAAGVLDRHAAAATLAALQETWPEPADQAAILYARWQMQPDDTAAREAAADAYHDLSETDPAIDNRRRYAAAAGTSLPPPAPLPQLALLAASSAPSLDTLLARIELMNTAR